MEENIKIKTEDFKKNADGSWTLVRNTDLEASIGVIRLTSGMTFKKGMTILGFDVAEILDNVSSGKK